MVDKGRRQFCKYLLAGAVILTTPTIISGCVKDMQDINTVYEAGAKKIPQKYRTVEIDIGNRDYFTRMVDISQENEGEYLPFLIAPRIVFQRDPKTWEIITDGAGNPVEIPCVNQIWDDGEDARIVITKGYMPKRIHDLEELRIINRFYKQDSSETKNKINFSKYSNPLNMISHDRRKISDLDLLCLDVIADDRDPKKLPIFFTYWKPNTRVENHFIFVHENGGFYRPELITEDQLREITGNSNESFIGPTGVSDWQKIIKK